MDSLTQIVLGAAVGEVCLGRKLGNKAMVWGAIAGTIPDLDVLGNLFLSELDALAFHRGISHSIFFAVTFSFLIAYLAKRLYDSDLYKHKFLRISGGIFATLSTVFLVFIFALVGYTAANIKGLIIMGVPSLAFGFLLIRRTWITQRSDLDIDKDISYKAWYNFFFWSIFTHPILDCFTVYGTQLFQPFSDYRVSWDNISVADPIYTFLFGASLMVASFFNRNNPKRRQWNYLGILLSSLYMIWTFSNKSKVNTVMEDSLARRDIVYTRYMTSPTILNNILWSGTADADSSLWIGQYSLFDQEKDFDLQEVPKNRHLLNKAYTSDRALKVLEWFSNDYCALLARKDGNIQMNDLRYGQFDLAKGNNVDNYIFRFVLEDTGTGYKLGKADGGPPPGREKEIFKQLWARIMGEKSK